MMNMPRGVSDSRAITTNKLGQANDAERIEKENKNCTVFWLFMYIYNYKYPPFSQTLYYALQFSNMGSSLLLELEMFLASLLQLLLDVGVSLQQLLLCPLPEWQGRGFALLRIL